MSFIINRAVRSLLALCIAACGDETTIAPSDADARHDELEPLDIETEVPEIDTHEPDIDSSEPETSDTFEVADAPRDEDNAEVTTPVRCDDGHVCNDLLDGEGRCPGRCIALSDSLSCAGVVVDAVCHPSDPRVVDPPVRDIGGGLTVVLVAPPVPAKVGDVQTVIVDVENAKTTVARRPFGANWSAAWEVLEANFFDTSELVVPANGKRTLTATMRAAVPDVLDGTRGRVMNLYIGDAEIELHAGIAYPDDAPVVCGGFHFPAELEGRCCGDVFFPGAACCTSNDCAQGGCADGYCVADAPELAGSRPLHGTHAILLVVVDAPELTSDSPCADRTDALTETLGLDRVTAFYADRTRARAGRDVVDFRWHVVAGIDSADIVAPGPERWVPFYRDHLAAWLAIHAADGCPQLADFDEVIIAGSGLDLHGYGGLYLGGGLVGASAWSSPFLFAHELGHAFGATDLGYLLGNRFLWTRALMGTYGTDDASDQVAWAQWGLADLDRSGVLDLAETAAYPESFDVGNLRAEIIEIGTFGNPELRVTWTPVALERGATRYLVHDEFDVTLPEHGWHRTWQQSGRRKMLAFQRDEIDWAGLLERGAVTVRWTATHAFTRADGSRAAVSLDRLANVPLQK